MAPVPQQVPARGPGARGLIACALIALASGCGAGLERAAEPELRRERLALGASFVGGRASGLRELLHEDLIVQPPAPDSPLRGAEAGEYLEQLARESQVTRSELLPVSLSREGRLRPRARRLALGIRRPYIREPLPDPLAAVSNGLEGRALAVDAVPLTEW